MKTPFFFGIRVNQTNRLSYFAIAIVKKSVLQYVYAIVRMTLLIGAGNLVHGAFWYVDRDAYGANNGSSWKDAWTSPNDIVWANVQPGDTIFFSGGLSEKIYTNSWTVGKSGLPGKPIVFRPGQDPGHSGTVIFDYDFAGDSGGIDAVFMAYRSHLHFNGRGVDGQIRWQFRNNRHITRRTAGIVFVGWGGGDLSPMQGCVFEYLSIDNCNNGFRFWNGVTNFVIRHCQLNNIRGDGAIGIFSVGNAFDENSIHNNYIETAYNTSSPPGYSGYVGPDGVQGGGGLTINNNIFKVVRVDYYTSTQHPDTLQVPGNYLRIYNNEFINVGDSAVSPASWGKGEHRRDIWIYNNVFRIIDPIDPYPEYIRLYNNMGQILSLTNLKILNNTFIDNTGFAVVRFSNWGTDAHPTGDGNEIRNNIFYACGDGLYRPVIFVKNSTNFHPGSLIVSHNVYYHPQSNAYIHFRGTNYPAVQWIAFEPGGTTDKPVFRNYTPNSVHNDLRLNPQDIVAHRTGVVLSHYFTTDKQGISRGARGYWDRGAYEVQAVPAAPILRLE